MREEYRTDHMVAAPINEMCRTIFWIIATVTLCYGTILIRAATAWLGRH